MVGGHAICMSTNDIIDVAELGAALRYAAVDKNAVVVAGAGDTSKVDCERIPAQTRTRKAGNRTELPP